MPAASVLCIGAAGLDYLAYVNAFPKPDDKVALHADSLTESSHQKC